MKTGHADERQLEIQLKLLDVDVVALGIASSVLRCIGQEVDYRKTCLAVGQTLNDELFGAGLLVEDRKRKKEEKHVRKIEAVIKARKPSTASHRKAIAKRIARGNGYKDPRWSAEQRARVGHWGCQRLLEAAPDLFIIDDSLNCPVLTVTPEAMTMVEEAFANAVLANPAYQPLTVEPKAWTGTFNGGYWDRRVRTKLIRTRHKETDVAVKEAIQDGSMKPALDALNALQSVPWAINRPVLEVIQHCRAQGIEVKGLPGRNLTVPAHGPWEEMTEDERRLWKRKAVEVKLANLSLIGEEVGFMEALSTAEGLAQHERFYTPMNLDWRGRVYALPSFNFQRQDWIRSLFLFAEGEPLGDDGLFWLKVHVANCGDFDKISKKPFKERVAWVDQNLDLIQHTVFDPLLMDFRWMEADKPFLFLAACIELTGALQKGSQFVTCLPVSFDGSCSGLQHLCAMTRAGEGSLVNLTCSSTPQDVYQTVADQVKQRVQADADAGDAIAQCALAHGVDRSVVKRNVMTYSYSSKRFGMASQQQEDLMEPLKREVLEGKREEHPFEAFSWGTRDRPGQAARYLADRVFAGIEEVVDLPAQAMTYLQKLAKSAAHEGKPLRWTTPVGLPWINRYHVPVIKTVRLWMHDRGVRVPHEMNLAVGDHKQIDKDKAANGVAPNFVHALDASHLLLTVNACAAEGITSVATVHDSFGCLASKATRFRGIILEQFVKMYEEHDVLREVLAQATADLTLHNRDNLPDVPEYGPLELKEVLNAEFAFA
jgi:DNA-directed RNA polymerase